MGLPDYETLMMPLLEFASDGLEHRSHDPLEFLVTKFALTEDERYERLPSGGNKLYDRMHWALSYLRQARLLEMTRRGYFRITERGRSVYATRPNRIDSAFLKRYPEFQEFLQRKGRGNGTLRGTDNSLSPITQSPTEAPRETILSQPVTPKETLEESFGAIRQELVAELLDRIKACSPRFFEELVVELIVKMGYGGSRQDAGAAVGRSGDGGIDGIIKEDRLGLDVIYIQAKRWDGVIGRPEIQRFAGALHGQHARKGIFITTSQFARDAREYVQMLDLKIVLIDGEQLAEFMIEHDVGVATVSTYHIKRVDSDYFAEE